ncbi:MAG: biotin--[acetyl-CoA-carboxylase] ligase [Clostridia bacterium]|jgi:BirA family biotin operon repressor/biotin-[acetyl-CoA-carboxylase] ligase|nr:biotin--[acetyl-CoA-carboxylase] ligase [Clostridia bacterium]
MKIELLEEVSSTNDYIRRYLEKGEDAIVCARRQTGGKGTKGRSFRSCEGGVYFSALRFFTDLPARNAFLLMQHAAASVCRTVGEYGVSAAIKWPNDVYANGRKIAGILIENAFSGGAVKSSIVGIGLNVSNDLGEYADVAVNLCEAAGRAIDCDRVRARLIENFCGTDLLSGEKIYREYVRLGNISVTTAERTFSAVALRVLGDGRLEIDEGGKISALSAAEVSIRL